MKPPSELERALLCERLNWRLLPHELDDLDPAELKVPLRLLDIFRVFRRYGDDLEGLSEPELATIKSVEDLRDLLEGRRGS